MKKVNIFFFLSNLYYFILMHIFFLLVELIGLMYNEFLYILINNMKKNCAGFYFWFKFSFVSFFPKHGDFVDWTRTPECCFAGAGRRASQPSVLTILKSLDKIVFAVHAKKNVEKTLKNAEKPRSLKV